MRILVVIPALDPEVNDIGQALRWISEQGHEVVCLAASRNPSKLGRRSPARTELGSLRILRPWPTYQFAAEFPEAAALSSLRLARPSPFDVVLCIHGFNYPLVRWINRLYGRRTPVAVLFEEAWRISTLMSEGTRVGLAHRFRGISGGKGFYRWIASQVDAIATSDPLDLDHLEELRELNPRTVYVPWCTDPGRRRRGEKAQRGTGVFAGALTKNKHPEDLLSAVSTLARSRYLTRFTLVTSQVSGPSLVEWLSEVGSALEARTHLSLLEVASVIARSEFGITAAAPGGWGFIGNCWAMETPIILLRPNGFVRNKSAAIPAWEFGTAQDAVRAVQEDESLKKRTVIAGFQEFERSHSAKAVGSQLLQLLNSIAGTERSGQALSS